MLHETWKRETVTLWFRTTKNRDVSTGLVHLLIRSNHSFICSILLASHCLFQSHTPLQSIIRSFAHSLTSELVGKWMITDVLALGSSEPKRMRCAMTLGSERPWFLRPNARLYVEFSDISKIFGDNREEIWSSSSRESTMVQENQESRRKYWATHSSVCSFARTAQLFACSPLLALIMTSAALTQLLARSLTHSFLSLWKSEWLAGFFFCSGP